MRRIFKSICLLLLSVLIQGCTREHDVEIQDAPNRKNTTFVSVQEATENLQNFMNSTSIPTRSGEQRSISEVVTLGGFGESRAAEATEDTPLVYLFNFDNDEGFALVSGDTRVGGILAFVEEGNLDPKKGIENPGFAIFLEHADIYYRLKTGLPLPNVEGQNTNTRSEDDPWEDYDPDIDADYVEYSEWTDRGVTSGYILPCKWSQGYPLNRYCKTADGQQALVGCVAIAVGQIMYRHAHNYTYNGTYYDWDTIFYYKSASNYNEEALDMAARLVADLGRPENLDMDYGVNASGAYNSNVARTFANFGYTRTGSSSTTSGYYTANGPIYVSGTRLNTSSSPDYNPLGIYSTESNYSSHAWIIDASLEQERAVYTYLYNGILAKTEYEYRTLCHCNWGWGGLADGYYMGDLFQLNECVIPDTSVYNSSNHYDRNINYIHGIRPY